MRIAIVTPSYGRQQLLSRLLASLESQTDRDFLWVVVDDASDDSTPEWLEAVAGESPVALTVLRNPVNRGKCASLNRAFSEIEADVYLVVDSDDRLISRAVEIVRDSAQRSVEEAGIGALFFSYKKDDGSVLQPKRAVPEEIVATRAEFDARYGKYDGCVGYFRRAVDRYHYSEFPGETYIGPTTLQLKFAPEFAILFSQTVIGIAEYQADGLSAAGRLLRIRNPLGMMEYAGLQYEQATDLRSRVRSGAMYHAYRSSSAARGRRVGAVKTPPSRWLYGVLGSGLAAYWRLRFRTRDLRQPARQSR